MSKEKASKKESKFVEMPTVTANEVLITAEGKDGRLYRFEIPWASPLDECYHAAVNVANEIANLFNESIEKQKKAAEEKSAKAEEKEAEEDKS